MVGPPWGRHSCCDDCLGEAALRRGHTSLGTALVDSRACLVLRSGSPPGVDCHIPSEDEHESASRTSLDIPGTEVGPPGDDASAVPGAAWAVQKDGSIHGGSHLGFRRFSSVSKLAALGPASGGSRRPAQQPSNVEEHDACTPPEGWNRNETEAVVRASGAEA